jgi:hypothetical protein
MRLGTSGPVSVPAVGNLLVLGLIVMVASYALSRGLTSVSFTFAAGVLFALTMFGLVFLRSDWGIYLVIVSMLLSPEFGAGGSGESMRGSITLRTEDFVLLVIGFSWLAKTAVNKELGLITKTPLNVPIVLYIAATTLATTIGYLTGTVRTQSGFFFVLKYVEYFVVYYMVVNNLRDRPHAWRMVVVAFTTAAIVSVVGIAQIPSGERVSAPFEGEVGEPNTFGGYLLILMAIAAGIALETRRFRLRVAMLALLTLMTIPFAFTLSRASFLGVVPAMLVLTALTSRRRFMVGILLLALVFSPLIAVVAPGSVTKRVLYTFEPERGQPTVRVGRVGFDPSTSARLLSFRQAIEGWQNRPLFGYGVTGFGFMDAQYARTLVETGLVGFAAFAWLLWSILRTSTARLGELDDPDDRGLTVGFVAGMVGLLVHAIGSNTFIIVRIMEPFWLFAGIIMMLPVLERAPAPAPAPPQGPAWTARRLR